MSKYVENSLKLKNLQNKNFLKNLAKMFAFYFYILYNKNVLIRHGGVYEYINES